MKKKIFSMMMVLILAFAMTACGSSKDENTSSQTPTEESTTEETPAAQEATEEVQDTTQDLSGTIVITGSTSVEKIINDMIDEFTALNPNVNVTYTGTGSSAGIEDSIGGVNTLGVSSRDLKNEESEAGAVSEVFAYDGIAVAVNPANDVTDISIEDLCKIYSGEITNWNQVGGKDAEIVVVSREGASGTKSAFEELIGLEDAGGLTENAMVVEGNGNVQATVAGDENAIGYVSFSFVDESVKALTVAGVEATAENAKAGSYPLSRPFLFVYNSSKELPVEAKAFVEFALSADGQVFVEEHGGIVIG
ncbi:phosphate ABC transporter substrate-binding protein [Anaeromicropila populeti]|uniref:Phosphate-binding protein n=1 Tax=Anaeromicropila populeti TaxID=37658 RepID=A0A1I6JAT6_9FIRM|nr:phosphate ABC transporter substrate-binding protein [Anaeromicropila populeti]SFR75650.1 phosphate transport system substrate-binding protein [Anaeromicropila populeti]